MRSLFNDFLASLRDADAAGLHVAASMKNTMRMRKSLGAAPRRDRRAYGEWHRGRGSPRTVRDQLARLREETGANKLVTMLQFGVLSDELTRRNMEMFASEVMPHLR